MEMFVWNMVLSVLLALFGFIAREKSSELQRLTVLVNRTREEVARDHITRSEFRADMQMLMDRFDRLERKLDAVIAGRRSAGDMDAR